MDKAEAIEIMSELMEAQFKISVVANGFVVHADARIWNGKLKRRYVFQTWQALSDWVESILTLLDSSPLVMEEKTKEEQPK